MAIISHEGSLDLLIKIGYEELESSIGDEPVFLWWGTWFVEGKNDENNEESPPPEGFVIVDNLDPHAKRFILKELRITKPIVINKGTTPCIVSVAESGTRPPKYKPWVHIGKYCDRLLVAESIKNLEKTYKNIELCVGINSISTIHPEL